MNYILHLIYLLITCYVAKSNSSYFRITPYLLLEENNEKSYVYSPISAESILSMLYFGTKGLSHKELEHFLGYSTTSETTVKNIFNKFHTPKVVTNGNFSAVSRLYVDSRYPLNESYVEFINDVYYVKPKNVEFKEETRQSINSEVAIATNQKIQNLIAEPFEPLTVFVLLNTLYLKAEWEFPFPISGTTKTPFIVSSEKTVNVDMMYSEAAYEYYELPSVDSKVLNLYLAGTDLKMTIVLPNKVDGLKDFYKDILHLSSFRHGVPVKQNEANGEPVAVNIPKFKIETEINLKDKLPKWKVDQIFNLNTDFSPIIKTTNGIGINTFLQKIVFEVNEGGLEASAATDASGFVKNSPRLFFNANHPFYFEITDKDTQYFAGQVVDF